MAPTFLAQAPPPLFECSFNKQVLKAFPYPITITALQFAIGSLLACTMWLLGLHKKPEGDVVENVGARPHGPSPSCTLPACCVRCRRASALRQQQQQRREALQWWGGVWPCHRCMTRPERDRPPALRHAPFQAKTLSPLAVVHTLGNALTNISLGAVAVSFTHTIKALEPMFSGGGGCCP